jgi:ApaG protein
LSTSEVVTNGIRVRVESRFSPDHSRPGLWFFLYTIRISNEGEGTVQLMTRHWVIRDATGRVEEVNGPGVVGEQPVLEPGASFEYTSGCPLPTPFGSMVGKYRFVDSDGEGLDADVAEFQLREPSSIH